MDTTLKERHTVRFSFEEKKYLLGFLNEWMGLDMANFFQLTIQTPSEKRTNILKRAYIVQMVPNGETLKQDNEYLDILDKWINNPSQDETPFSEWEWTIVEVFPRFVL